MRWTYRWSMQVHTEAAPTKVAREAFQVNGAQQQVDPEAEHPEVSVVRCNRTGRDIPVDILRSGRTFRRLMLSAPHQLVSVALVDTEVAA